MIATARKEVHLNRKSKEEGKYDHEVQQSRPAGLLSESPAALVSGASVWYVLTDITTLLNDIPISNQISIY